MKKFNYTMNHKADEAYMAANAEKAAVSEPDLGGRCGAGRRTGGFDFLISTKEGRIPMLKAISQVQKKIKVGTHGEDYGSWMSNPVFYVFGGGIAAGGGAGRAVVHHVPQHRAGRYIYGSRCRSAGGALAGSRGFAVSMPSARAA